MMSQYSSRRIPLSSSAGDGGWPGSNWVGSWWGAFMGGPSQSADTFQPVVHALVDQRQRAAKGPRRLAIGVGHVAVGVLRQPEDAPAHLGIEVLEVPALAVLHHQHEVRGQAHVALHLHGA